MLVSLLTIVAKAQYAYEQIIVKALNEQVVSWNKGDIDGFMITYWNSDSLMFIGKNGITYGWKNTRANYIKSYPDTTTMGKLQFELLSIKQLSPNYCSVIGKWQLTRQIGNVGGAFTLLFKKIKNKWLIVQDHSS